MSALPIPFPPPAIGGLTGPAEALEPSSNTRRYPRLVHAVTKAVNRWGENLIYDSIEEGQRIVKGRVTLLKSEIVVGAEMLSKRICIISPEHWDASGFTTRPKRGDELRDSERPYRVEQVEIARYAGEDGRYELTLEG